MWATVSFQQKKMIHRLLKTGRWNNASEIIRYGLELVRREVEHEDLRPYPDSVLAGVYKQFSQEERRQDSELGRASALPAIGELDRISGSVSIEIRRAIGSKIIGLFGFWMG